MYFNYSFAAPQGGYNSFLFSEKISGLIHLFRPEFSLAAGICVLTGQILALGYLPTLTTGILGFISVFCLSGSALTLNDYFDYEVDKINAPKRPLPSGVVSRRDIIALTVVTTPVGLFAAYLLGLPALLVGVVIWLIGFLYNWRYKRAGLPGNLMVSTSVAATFIFGTLTEDAPWNGIVWTFSLMAFFIDLGEEITVDAMDIEGDKVLCSRSIALLKGRLFAMQASVALWGLVILLGLLPILMGWLVINYLLFILVTDALLILFPIRLIKSKDAVTGHRAMRGIYLGAILAIIAFPVGQLVGRSIRALLNY